ncbi:hypothetical protein MNV49_005704 [Pseudohyphozyma bogoriensis]|nr:hypothetical protein MNV49_005704 [Pseudohyphozyma bogoriensis]
MGRKEVIPDKVPITTPQQLASEFALLAAALELDETEHTWERIDNAVKRFHAVVRGGGCNLHEEFVHSFKEKKIVVGIVRSMLTERTRLSASTLDLMGSSSRLGHAFGPLLLPYLPSLLRLLCRTNKLYISRASATLSRLITHTKLPDILKYIVAEWKAEPGKSASFRIEATKAVGELLQVLGEGLAGRVEELEWVIKASATDREAKVREYAKSVWEAYKNVFGSRVAA